MQWKNRTDWPDYFLQRMLRWVCGQLNYPYHELRRVDFGKRSTCCYSGRAWWGRERILVRIGPPSKFPVPADHRPGYGGMVLVDDVEALVKVTAHEIQHLMQSREKRIADLQRRRKVEFDARWSALMVLTEFRDERAWLMRVWSKPPVTVSQPTKRECNAAKAAAALDRWQRKLKLAQTKVRKYRAAVRRYEKQGIMAATGEK